MVETAEHNNDLGHHILLKNSTSILASEPRCKDWIRKEATEIELHHNNTNNEDGFSLIRLWKPLMQSQKQLEAVSLQEQHRNSFLKAAPLLRLSMGGNRHASLLPTSHCIHNSHFEFCSCDMNLWCLEEGQLVSIFHESLFPPENSSGFQERPVISHYSIFNLRQ
jgi:hypothetical protein